MAGTIFGLGLSQQIDADGKPLSGCKLYLYAANSSQPVDAFKDYGLTATLKHPWPIDADGQGRIPAFWLADGAYRARLVTAAGVPIFDESVVQALGPSSGEGGGGGGVDATAIFSTGDFSWQPRTGTRAGWVRANGRTIGSATSGGSERASSDCETLFLHLWNTYADSICAVVAGRGANAAADWAANKQITLPDLRGTMPVGVDGMGSTPAGRLTPATVTTGTNDTALSKGGVERHTLAVSELPSHDHGGATSSAEIGDLPWYGFQEAGNADQILAFVATGSVTQGTQSVPSSDHVHPIPAQGGGAAHNNMPPFATGTWYVKV